MLKTWFRNDISRGLGLPADHQRPWREPHSFAVGRAAESVDDNPRPELPETRIIAAVLPRYGASLCL